MDGEYIVAHCGWVDRGDIFQTCGTKVSKGYTFRSYKGEGISNVLRQKRLKVIGSNPAMSFINNSTEGWLKSLMKEGWEIGSAEDLPEQYRDLAQQLSDSYTILILNIKSKAMKKAWEILKRVDIRNAEEYERASLEDRRKWHKNQANAYGTRLKALQRTHNVINEESPMYKEMVELQELFRFHSRQRDRIRRGYNQKDFYSLELETIRQDHKGLLTPQGNPMPYTELSQDIYETLSDNEKFKYHRGMYKKTDGEEKIFHGRMGSRIQDKSKLPTFASFKHGGKPVYGITNTREEYENMSNEDKSKYHGKMATKARRNGDIELHNFHNRQYKRLKTNSNLPTYFSMEDE